jgi:hypothetical protein
VAKLKAKTRNALPGKDFAGPDRSYPVEDASHARNALARVSNKSPALKSKVDAKVRRRHPGHCDGVDHLPKNRAALWI